MAMPVLRFNFASPRGHPHTQHQLIATALEMAAWGDTRGVAAVSVDEHHVTGHGWSANPIMAAAVFLARTQTIYLSVDCALGPLWNPLRLAEDIGFADTMSGGRLITTVGLGYRPVEYAAMGQPFSKRGAQMDRMLEKLLEAWSDAPIAEGAIESRVGSGTWSKPHPPLFVGGGVKASARRAARFGLGLSLPAHQPELAQYYLDLCAAADITPNLIMPAPVNRGMIFLHEDPERAWNELGEHILWEAVTYGAWTTEALSMMHIPGAETIDDVRASGKYRFLTPDQLLAEAQDPDYGPMVFHPLVGGMPIDEAWKSVQLLTDRVIPHLGGLQ
jgi:alkanesulfonate monooxygenase SsuD/methylene tetrahydromethanopterin reductase-like flavin-dependent oxidoreductase (luciferase family)